MSSSETYRGIVHGSVIELQQSPNVPDGMEVEVVIKRAELTADQRQEQLKTLFGSCQEDAEDLDGFLKLNDEQRKQNRRGQEL